MIQKALLTQKLIKRPIKFHYSKQECTQTVVGGGWWAEALQPNQNEIKKKAEFVDMISNVLHNLPFGWNQPLQLHLDLQQDFDNTAFKIKHKLYIATGSVAPLPK